MDLTGIGSAAEFAKGIMDRFFPKKMNDAETAQTQLHLQEIIEKRDNAIAEAKKSIIVAEMNQGDNFTKRARPTLVYCGLFFIFLVHVFFPIITYLYGKEMPTLKLPTEFWWAWSGVCGVWVIGRSAEKRGAANKIVGMITGNK